MFSILAYPALRSPETRRGRILRPLQCCLFVAYFFLAAFFAGFLAAFFAAFLTAMVSILPFSM
jgi:hypothetical protein